MRHKFINAEVFSDTSWWHWAITIPLLAFHLAGVRWPVVWSIILCAAMVVYFCSLLRSMKEFPVQVRLAYLGLLVLGIVPGMNWIHWVQLVGTTAQVLFGYCLLSRTLRLAPYNRLQPLTVPLIFRELWHEPNAGGLLNYSRNVFSSRACCSVSTPELATKRASRQLPSLP